jgi:hypothetical protein
MNNNTQRVDDILQKTEVPVFENAEHQAKLASELMKRHGEEAQAAPARAFGRGRRLVWAGAVAALLIVAIGLPLRGFIAPTRVWAEVLTALEQVDSFVMTTTFHREGESDSEAHEAATFYYREGSGYAVLSPRRKAWNLDGDMYQYDAQSDSVTIIRGMGMPPVRSCFQDNRLLTGLGRERDCGEVVRDGQTYRLLEVVDDTDPTQRAEVYYDPESMLPVTVLTYQRNTGDESWRLGREDSIAYNVPIDDAVFVPDYPDTAKVTERAPNPTEMAVVAGKLSEDVAWMEDAAAIVFHGEKFLAAEDVWLSPSGWVGVKFRTNLWHIFASPVGFREDPVNQERWDADKSKLHSLACGSALEAEPGVHYFAQHGDKHTGNRDGTHGYLKLFRLDRDEFPSDDFRPKELLFRTITIIRDKGRGESMKHYIDWRNEPEKWQMLELIIPVPDPSLTPPPSFNEEDLEWMRRTEVERTALMARVNSMRIAGRTEDVYQMIKGEPESVQRLYGAEWLLCLRDVGKAEQAYALYEDAPQEEKLRVGTGWIAVLYELGKEDEAREFFRSYKDYCTEKYGDDAHFNIDAAESYIKRFAEKQ